MSIVYADEQDASRPVEYGIGVSACPCCGHEIEPTIPTVRFNYWKGLLYRGTERVFIGPKQADIVQLLLDKWPEVVSKEKIFVGLYGANYLSHMREEDAANVLRFLVCKLNKQIRRLGLSVACYHNKGYFLDRYTG